ncbi:MAG: formate dehydrogenase accessory sulfurtransferase FdhD [Thermoprotei archaeon]|nr:MAG: formate dehydrogenase accessory sulfurtransferase FdhD [Thermoprotei archaeon]
MENRSKEAKILYMVNEVIKVEIKNGKTLIRKVQEPLVREYALNINIHGLKYRTYLISPNMFEEFIYGNLLSLGIIDSIRDVDKIKFVNNEVKIYLKYKAKIFKTLSNVFGPSCEEKTSVHSYSEKVLSNVKISANYVIEALKKFYEKSEVFRITGGVHAAALFNINSFNLLVFTEDIGRHNAIDKVIGWGFLRNIDFSKILLLTSGRIFTDSIVKAVRAGIPIMVSKSAPTFDAVVYARKTNITLIGFARGKRFNVYSNPQRIRELENIVFNTP